MLLEGDVLQIDIRSDAAQIDALGEFVAPRLEYIDEIRIAGDSEVLPPQRLLQLLVSIKKSRPQIRITLLERESWATTEGTVRWILA